MPWSSPSVMDQKLQFVADCLRGEEPVSVLCERYGISRQTGHLWKRRYQVEGASGLEERSRAPHVHGRAMPREIAQRIIELRHIKPYWGPKKLLAILAEKHPDAPWPSPSAASDLLRREGLSAPRRRRRVLPVEQPFAAIGAANDTWCIDFKGWFRTGDGHRCDPLTVTDAFSRYLLGLKIVEPVTEAVQKEMDRLFREHGLPRSIRSDNGTPFASTGAGGLTRLSARWAKMGIQLERIQPGKPQQNGRHERMHGTLKAEACKPAQKTPKAQQARFDAFRAEYNGERPHEALGQIPPTRLYHPSPRPYAAPKGDPDYGDDQVRRIRTSGEIRWSGGLIFVSEALVGEAVALREQDDGCILVRFCDVPLLLFDPRKGKALRYGPGRPPRPIAAHQSRREVSGMYPD